MSAKGALALDTRNRNRSSINNIETLPPFKPDSRLLALFIGVF
jgi:hypothetical protein